ncbi:TSUP family transporter [Actinoplanes sp. NPDC026623]|uniref:TSUP family transporter n=1 Tax=Actinoplanes sp. NPDC026623 TaxID=3155610 RepID=UPI0033D5753C
MAVIAAAALGCTLVTSAAGAATYGLLASTTTGDIAPHWTLGLLCGAGGLIGGYLGARLQSRVPERALRLLLGALATMLAVVYLVQASPDRRRASVRPKGRPFSSSASSRTGASANRRSVSRSRTSPRAEGSGRSVARVLDCGPR